MGEDIDTISPTLGFNIVSLEFKKCVARGADAASLVSRQRARARPESGERRLQAHADAAGPALPVPAPAASS